VEGQKIAQKVFFDAVAGREENIKSEMYIDLILMYWRKNQIVWHSY